MLDVLPKIIGGSWMASCGCFRPRAF